MNSVFKIVVLHLVDVVLINNIYDRKSNKLKLYSRKRTAVNKT